MVMLRAGRCVCLCGETGTERGGWRAWDLQRVELDGAIRVQTKTVPGEVKPWPATNPNACDFRLETIGPVWQSTVLFDQGKAVYVGRIAALAKG